MLNQKKKKHPHSYCVMWMSNRTELQWPEEASESLSLWCIGDGFPVVVRVVKREVTVQLKRLPSTSWWLIPHFLWWSMGLVQDMTARDLLQQRYTLPNGDTAWRSSPLVTAALEGKLVLLDGIHRVSAGTLAVLQRFVPVPRAKHTPCRRWTRNSLDLYINWSV